MEDAEPTLEMVSALSDRIVTLKLEPCADFLLLTPLRPPRSQAAAPSVVFAAGGLLLPPAGGAGPGRLQHVGLVLQGHARGVVHGQAR